MARSSRESRTTVWLAAAGTLLVFGYAALAVVQMLVLNPLAAVPGIPLAQIYDDMAGYGGTFDTWFAVVIMAIGPLAAVFLLVATVVRSDISSLAIVVAFLTLLMLGAFAYFVAAFYPGMTLADTYAISGGAYAPWYLVLYATSAAALVGLVGVAIGAMTIGRRAAAQITR